MKITLVKSSDKLHTLITDTLQKYTTVGAMVHQAVVSGLYHACIHGDPVYLNRIFQGLRSNDKQAMKLYIRRAFIVNGLEGKNPDGLPSETIIAACTAGEVLSFKKDEFHIIAGPNTAIAKSLAKLCAQRFITPDGERDHKVLDRNNFAEVKTLGDEEVLKQIIKLAKLIEPSDNKVVKVSASTKSLVADVVAKAENHLAQSQLAA